MDESRRAQYEQEAKRLKEGFEKGAVSFWGPKVGKNIIRILPPANREGDADAIFFKKIKVHWGVGPNKKRVTCRKTIKTSESCPVCEYSDELISSGRKEDVQAGRDFSASERYVMNIVDVQDTGKGVQVFESSRSLFNDILQLFLDEDYGDIDSLETGRHIKIDRVGSGKFDTRYTVIPAGSPTSVDSRIMERVYDLGALYQIPTVDEVVAVLQGEEPVSKEERNLESDVSDMLAPAPSPAEKPSEEVSAPESPPEISQKEPTKTTTSPSEEKQDTKPETEVEPSQDVGDMLEIPVGDEPPKSKTPPASSSRAEQLRTMREDLKDEAGK